MIIIRLPSRQKNGRTWSYWIVFACVAKIMCFPKDSPHINAVEKCWHQGKRVPFVSEYYKTFADMCNAISAY